MHFTNGIPMNKCYFIGTNRTNGRIECNPTQPEANRNIPSPHNEMHFTNRINDIPLVPTQHEANGNIQSPHNEMRSTNGKLID